MDDTKEFCIENVVKFENNEINKATPYSKIIFVQKYTCHIWFRLRGGEMMNYVA